MNKSTFALAALALIAASCTKTEVVGSGPETSGSGINFSACTAKPSKAAQPDVTPDVTTDNFTSFEVTAIGNGAIYFDDVTFTKNASSIWESENPYFWPAFGLNFYAYNTPANTTGFERSITTAGQTIKVTPATELAKQEDLVAAKALNQTLASTNSSLATDLTFNHYLTQVIVKAKNSNSTYKVKVDGVKFANLAGEGTYSFSTEKMAAPEDKINSGTSADYVATFGTTELSGTETEVMTDGDAGRWYFVPQEVKPWDQANNKNNASVAATNNGTYLALKVKITAKHGNSILKIYPATGDDSAWMAVPVPVAQDATKFALAQGKKYTFIINFFSDNSKSGAGFVDPEVPGDLDGDGVAANDNGKKIIGGAIKFNATVVEWLNPNEANITISL